MPTQIPRRILEAKYNRLAQEYLNRLPLEHFMESTPHATQRKITLESLDLVSPVRPDVHVFNELLVQYEQEENGTGQVVPDNMVVIHDGPIDADTSYAVPLQPAGPFWVLEYVSKNITRRDYEENMLKYERDLRVPYYLVFYPEAQEWNLYRLKRKRYVSVKPDKNGRCPLPELELEVGLHENWIRFWFRGELLPLPAELLRQRDEERAARRSLEQRVARLEAEMQELRRGQARQKS